MSGTGFFHVFVAAQNQSSWFVVSIYTAGGVQLPAGDPAPLVVVVAPLICVHVPGVPVVVQKNRFCPAAASVAKYICPCVHAVGRDAAIPVFAGTVLAAPVKSTTATPPVEVNWPLAKLFAAVQLFGPASDGNTVVSGIGFFHVFAVEQNHNNWFVVSM